MAVDARHPSNFPQHLLRSREIIMNPIEANSNIYNTQIGSYGLPLSGTTKAESFLPVYGSVISDSFAHQKRSRESINPILSYPSIQAHNKSCTPFSFLGHDVSLQIQEQQLDVDRLVSEHMEKVRMEIEERRKRQARRIMDAMEGGVRKKLKAKEEEIEKISKMNWALEQRVKSLCMENQIWRDLAQTNEATANALRTNLEQVLAAAQDKEGRTPPPPPPGEGLEQDAESCCGSSWEDNINDCDDQIGSRLCRNCCKEESCVLLLPCRHLCLCTACGSSLLTCPVCKSPKTISVHINMS